MDSGYYAACAGLRAQTQALEIVANNLANVSTTGYRGQVPTFRSLLEPSDSTPIDPLNRAINDFNISGDTELDRASGNLEHTGNELDLAIQGSGFFAVRTPTGTLYTRNGNLQTSATNQLIDGEGNAVLGERGPITLPAGSLTISPDGTLSVAGAIAGKVQVVDFAREVSMTPVGRSYYSAPAGAVSKPAAQAQIRQGMIEASNVSAVTAMVNLIAVQRHAEMLQKALGVFHRDFNQIACNDLPKVS